MLQVDVSMADLTTISDYVLDVQHKASLSQGNRCSSCTVVPIFN